MDRRTFRLFRLTRRHLLLTAVLLGIVYAIFLLVVLIQGRDPVQVEALALYDKLRPGMTTAEFLELTKDELMSRLERGTLSGK